MTSKNILRPEDISALKSKIGLIQQNDPEILLSLKNPEI